MNDPYRQIEKLQQALASDKSRIAFLLGAGCPFSINIGDGGENKPLIQNTAGLTRTICDTLTDTNIGKIVDRIQLPQNLSQR